MSATTMGPQERATNTAPFWAIFRNSANPMLIADNDRRYVEVNDAAARLLGYGRELLQTMRIDDLTPPEARGGIEAAWGEFLARGVMTGEYPLLRPDGRTVLVEFNATAFIMPGYHLSIILIKDPEEDVSLERAAAPAPAPGKLTPRERDVLKAVAMGQSSAEAADTLGISRETARRHVQNAMKKLGVRTRAQAIGVALRMRLI